MSFVLSDNRAGLPTIFEYASSGESLGHLITLTDVRESIPLRTHAHTHSHTCTRTHTHICAHTHAHTVNSDVFKELEVMEEVFGGSRLYSIPNTLPLVGDFQEAEFDVQVGHVIVM